MYLLPNFGDQLEVWLNLPLQAVERVLELFGQLLSKFFPPSRTAGGHQIGNGADMIAPGFHGYMLQVEPGITSLVGLGLALLLPQTSREPVLHEFRKPVFFDY